ncbi:hypothetical protein [Burkholderia cenocepacia]|uniref:hypothetical protein n=1 Tax=Burkholderia cenocepacia TaxID=95486 RepID=UPI0026560532|nr:hypothetical protein [Burkholderia cenocepacia]MDN7458567.1 hypothetical protein [Burkholderia cenocepacia]
MTATSNTNKPLLAKTLAIFAAIFAVTGIVDGFYLLWQNQTANASLAFTVGILLLLFSQFERFESVKGFGIEAKVHQLNDKIQEADRINESLKSLTATLAQLTFEMMSRIGRLSGPIGRKESLEIEDAVLKLMGDAQIVEEEINRVVRPVRSMTSFDILRPAFRELDDQFQTWNKEMQTRLQQVQSPIAQSDPMYIAVQEERKRFDALRLRRQNIPELGFGVEVNNQLRQLATDMQQVPELKTFTVSHEFQEAVDDHLHYVSTGDHRDRARWTSSELE